MPIDRRLSFDHAPESYDRGRPGYPAQAFEDLFTYVRARRPGPSVDVVEVGPGTGQATKALLDRGARVTAVELGPHLADFMRRKFSSATDLRIISGAFEDVDLPLESFDLVLAATAWKWLDVVVRLPRAVRLLRSGGVLATLSTIQITSTVDKGFFERTSPLYKRYRPDEQWTAAPTEAEAMPGEYEEFRTSGVLENVTLRYYRWDQTYTSAEYEQLLLSYSDVLTMAPAAREGLIRDLKSTIDDEFGGFVTRPLVIVLTMGRK